MGYVESETYKCEQLRKWLGIIAVLAGSIFAPSTVRANQSTYAQHSWIKYSTSHFDLYTTASNGDYAAPTLMALERARAFFEQTTFRSSFPRTTVIAFASPAEYGAYRMNPGAYAFYQHSSQGDFILLQELDGQHTQAAVHEYVHFILHTAGYQLPLWLNEGLADLYSTLESNGSRVTVGRASPERMAIADGGRRISVQTLLQVDHRSPYYNDPSKMQLFYARSWALVHMLAMDEKYSRQFGAFVQAISEGSSSEQCFRSVYGKRVDEIQTDLDQYLSNRSLPVAIYDINVANISGDVRTSPLAQEQVDTCLAMVLAANPFVSGVERRIQDFANRYPNSPAFEESLGYLSIRTGRTQDALTHFSRAVERGSTDPLAIYYCARLQRDAGVPDERVIPLLQRVVALQPGDDNARIDLGFTAANANRFELALSTLSSVRNVQPNIAYEVFYAMAYCQAKLNRLGEAKRTGSQAKAMARTADQQRRADNLLRYVDQSESFAMPDMRDSGGQ